MRCSSYTSCSGLTKTGTGILILLAQRVTFCLETCWISHLLNHGYPTRTWESSIIVSMVYSCVKTINNFPGDILHLTFFGQHIVVLNSVYCADALMGKRASRYSGRPGFPMLELLVHRFHRYESNWYILFTNRMDWDWMMTLSPYSDWWRRARRCFQQNFRTAASQQYEPLQVSKVRELLKGLLTSLDEPGAHFKTCVSVSNFQRIYIQVTIASVLLCRWQLSTI